MSNIARWNAAGGKWVRYDDHRAEVERLKEQVAALTLAVEQADEAKADAEAAAAAEEAETDRVTCERDVAQAEVQRLMRELGGRSATNQQLTAERNAAQVEVERLKNAIDHLTSERDEAQADVEQLTQNLDAWKKDYRELEQERNRAWDLGEELNRELEGQKAANQRLLRECAEDIASAKAREEAAATELHETREKLARVQVQYDEFAKVTARVIDQHQRERDHARHQVYRLQQAGSDRPIDQPAQNLDTGNGQAILDSSRPDDETIWREAFMAAVRSRDFFRTKTANEVLAEYRKRWPR